MIKAEGLRGLLKVFVCLFVELFILRGHIAGINDENQLTILHVVVPAEMPWAHFNLTQPNY